MGVRWCGRWRGVVVGLLVWGHAYAATDWKPSSDQDVVQVLPTITRQRPAVVERTALARISDEAVMAQVREAIATARATGDSRYWGRAETALKGRWDRPDALPELAVLQATVLQGRHAFVQAQQVLTQALKRQPQQPQGWLTLATLQKLQGQYVQAQQSCQAMQRIQSSPYASACWLEARSMQGDDVADAWSALVATTSQPETQAWLLSLWAEHQERMGRDQQAVQLYQRSLRLAPDGYTSVALADVHLRHARARDALQVLQALPDTDAVLVRRATAHHRLGNAQLSSDIAQVLKERQAALERRGDDTTPVARELGLAALWLHSDPQQTLRWASANLTLQHESIDWMLALAAAQAAGREDLRAQWTQAWRKTGLVDARLTAWASTEPAPPSKAINQDQDATSPRQGDRP